MVHGFELCPKIFEKRGFVTFSLRSTGFLLRSNCEKRFFYLLTNRWNDGVAYVQKLCCAHCSILQGGKLSYVHTNDGIAY